MMIQEFDSVILTQDLPGTSLSAGDRGAVVMVYNDGEAYEVEFFSPEGRTIGLETIEAGKLELVHHDEKTVSHDKLTY